MENGMDSIASEEEIAEFATRILRGERASESQLRAAEMLAEIHARWAEDEK